MDLGTGIRNSAGDPGRVSCRHVGGPWRYGIVDRRPGAATALDVETSSGAFRRLSARPWHHGNPDCPDLSTGGFERRIHAVRMVRDGRGTPHPEPGITGGPELLS